MTITLNSDWGRGEDKRKFILKPENFPAFCKEYFDLEMGEWHRIANKKYLDNSTKRYLMQAPRGYAKSTYYAIIYSIWLVCRNRNEKIILAGNTLDRSMDNLRKIKNNLENNEKLIKDFGVFKPNNPEKWTEKIIYVAGTDITKEPTIVLAAVGSHVAGKRGTILICDDIVDEKNSATELQRKKVKDWFKGLLLPCLLPDGLIKLLGTEYSEFSLYQDIIKKPSNQYKGWEYVVYKELSPTNPGPNGELWPEFWNTDRIQARKNDIHLIAWEMTCQNNPKARDLAIFKENDLQYYDVTPKGLKVYMGIDLAISLKETANYFVILVAGIDPVTQNIYVLDILRKHLRFSNPDLASMGTDKEGQVEAILRFNAKWKPMGIGIGNKSYQDAMPQHLTNIAALPINRIDESTPKKDRMISLAFYFQNKKIFIRNTMNEFIEEYLTYDPDNRDRSPDQLDALDFAIKTGLVNINRKYITEVGGAVRKPVWMD